MDCVIGYRHSLLLRDRGLPHHTGYKTGQGRTCLLNPDRSPRDMFGTHQHGKSVDTIWAMPYRLDITDSLVQGKNSLELAVTNLWPNRIIGDAQPSARRHYTQTNIRKYTAASPLLPSGLIGPRETGDGSRDEVAAFRASSGLMITVFGFPNCWFRGIQGRVGLSSNHSGKRHPVAYDASGSSARSSRSARLYRRQPFPMGKRGPARALQAVDVLEYGRHLSLPRDFIATFTFSITPI